MKKRIGKISIVALLVLVSILMIISVFMQATTARTIKTVFIPQTGNVEAQGDVWYVDGNRPNDGGAGTSWADAYQLLSTAMLVSHNDIARTADRQWAARNTIYVKGDSITEDLTKLAQKTDIIGVGSNNAFDKASLIGTITITSGTNYAGCRFYNMMFQDNDAGGVLIDVDGQSGLQFQNCLFLAEATDTVGIKASDCSFMVINECEFSAVGTGNPVGFTTASIQIDEDNLFYNVKITNNFIMNQDAGSLGIDWNETGQITGCIIADNYIYTQGMPIDCENDYVMVTNNMMMTEIDCDTYAIGTGFDFDLSHASNNVLMGSGSGALANWVPPHE